MSRPFLFLLILIFPILLFGQSGNGDIILGKWINDSKKSIVEFFKEGDKYFGKTIWLADAVDENGQPKRDINNPDENLRDRLLVGLVCIKDFIFTGNNEYAGGTGYAPKYGKTLNGSIRLADDNTLELNIKLAFFSKTLTWTRIE